MKSAAWALALTLAGCGGGGSDDAGARADLSVTADFAPVAFDLSSAVDHAAPVDLAGADLVSTDLAWPSGDAFGVYPAGPYGSTVGATVPDFTFQAYYSALATSGLSSSQPFAPASFDQARTSGARALLVMFAGFT